MLGADKAGGLGRRERRADEHQLLILKAAEPEPHGGLITGRCDNRGLSRFLTCRCAGGDKKTP